MLSLRQLTPRLPSASINRSFASWNSGSSNVSRQARVAVVGSGRMGEIRSKILYANPRIEFVGVVDSHLEGAKSLAQTFGTNAYSSLSELINEEKGQVDGIVCCTPTVTHASIVKQAVKVGIGSGVFVEKPVDESAQKIKALFEISKRGNLNLCCGFQRRFDPSYQNLLHQLHNNHIGKPINGTVFFGDHPVPSIEFLLRGGDIFMDLSAHDVDFILQAMGRDDDVTSVFATGTSSTTQLEEAGVHDNATMVLKFQSGAVVTIFMSRSASYGYDQRCEIFGQTGMLQVGNIHETSAVLGNHEGIHRSKYEHSFPQRFARAFELEIDAFADTLIDGASWPITEDDCIRVQRIADAAKESCLSGAVVELYNNESDTDYVASSS